MIGKQLDIGLDLDKPLIRRNRGIEKVKAPQFKGSDV